MDIAKPMSPSMLLSTSYDRHISSIASGSLHPPGMQAWPEIQQEQVLLLRFAVPFELVAEQCLHQTPKSLKVWQEQQPAGHP